MCRNAAALVVAVIGILGAERVPAHTPHDNVWGIRLSPNFATDDQVFAIVRRTLLRSSDGGDTWTRLDHGIVDPGGVNALAMSPSFATDGTLFVSSGSGQVYRSEDRGITWTQAGRPLDPQGIVRLKLSKAFQADRLVLAIGASGRLFRSTDGGESWLPVSTGDSRIADLSEATDAMVAVTSSGSLLLSSDNAAVWRSTAMLRGDQTVTCLEIPDGLPADGPFYFGTAADGVYVASRDGDTYRARPLGLSGQHITSLASTTDRDGRLILFATTWREALFRSDDGGATWRRGDANLTVHEQSDKYGFPDFKGIALPDDFGRHPTIFLGAYDGLFKSIDGGATWRELETLSPSLFVGFDLATDKEGDLLIGASSYTAGAYFLNTKDMSWRIANVGLVTSRTGVITFSPSFATDRTVFAGMWGGVSKSTDGGARWHAAHLWSNTLRWLAWSLGYSNWSRVFPRSIAVSPDFAADGTLLVGTASPGLYMSTDAGQTYREIWDTDGQSVFAVGFSPDFATDNTAIVVLADGLYMTTDRGRTWTQIRACDRRCLPALAISPAFRSDRTIFAADRSGLLRTQNGGATWQPLPLPPCCQAAIDSVALSPAFATDRELLVSVTGLGLLRSRDKGDTFQPIAQEVASLGVPLSRMVNFPDTVPSVKYSPRYAEDKTIVASSWETLYLSTDGGERWVAIDQPPVRYENAQSAIVYYGSWDRRTKDHRYSASSAAVSAATGAEAVLRFVGHGFSLLGSRGPDQGIAELSLDGEAIGEIDQYSTNREYVVVLTSRGDLAPGPHELRLKVTGSRNTMSLGTRVELDSIDIFQ